MKYTYQKEIVLYAHYRNLDYFTTECTYAPEAFRGSARDLVKALERVRASAILDIVRSGEAFARLLRGPGRTAGEGKENGCGKEKGCKSQCQSQCQSRPGLTPEGDDGEAIGGCGSSTGGRAMGGEMHESEKVLRKKYAEEEKSEEDGRGACGRNREGPQIIQEHQLADLATEITLPPRKPQKQKNVPKPQQGHTPGIRKPQTLRNCTRCGYLSSQELCQACVMLEGLNRTRAKLAVQLEVDSSPDMSGESEYILQALKKVVIADGI